MRSPFWPPFFRPFSNIEFRRHFGRPLAPFWLPFGSLWAPFRFIWVPFGSLWVLRGSILAALAVIFAHFGTQSGFDTAFLGTCPRRPFRWYFFNLYLISYQNTGFYTPETFFEIPRNPFWILRSLCGTPSRLLEFPEAFWEDQEAFLEYQEAFRE